MFLNLAQAFESTAGNPQARYSVFLVHPLQLSRWLEEAWTAASNIPPVLPGAQKPFLGSDTIVDDLNLPTQPGAPPFLAASGIGADPALVDQWTDTLGPQSVTSSPGLIWHHLMYAYLVESTGVFEVVSELLRRLVNGEGLGQLTPESTKWVRSTEELFYRDPPLYSIGGVVSELRPYQRINRRQAYWRLFGFDLPHPIPSGARGAAETAAWKRGAGLTANSDFRSKWTELLRQVWMGLENRDNASGANPTDPSYVALLCEALQDMMNNRRRGGLMAREEFAYVTALSWFDLTLEANTPVVVDLKAEGSSPDERLSRLAERVGMKPAARTRELVLLAQPASALLRAIEVGLFSTAAQAETLFTGNTSLTNDMNRLINLWQSATGDRVKERPTAARAPTVPSQPLRIPKPSEPEPASNGVPR